MPWTDELEYVFYMSYPSGRTPMNMIDDFTRIIKAGIRNRMDQEHYWRVPDDPNYISGDGGKHRPESARIYAVKVGSDGYPNLMTPLKDYEDNVLYGVYTDANDNDAEDAQDDTTSQWKGSAWVRVKNKLRPLMSRFRGKFRFNGLAYLTAKNSKWHGVNVKGLILDDGHVTRGQNPDFRSDGIVLVPFHRHEAAPQGESTRLSTLLYPIRVGKFAPSDDTFTPLGATDPPTEGVGIAIGNYTDNTTGGVLFAFTKRGIEIYSSGSAASTPVLVDGIDIKNHNHSGGTKGKFVDATELGGMVYYTSKQKNETDIIVHAGGAWVPLARFGENEIIPRRRPIEPITPQTMSSSQPFDLNRLVVFYHVSLAFNMTSDTNAQMCFIGVGQSFSTGGNTTITIREATAIPLSPGSVSQHHALIDVVYTPENPIDITAGVNVYVKKADPANTLKFITVTTTITAMAWLRPVEE